jgi:hypothetical protein
VSRPVGQGTGEEARGAPPLDQHVRLHVGEMPRWFSLRGGRPDLGEAFGEKTGVSPWFAAPGVRLAS